jgi:SPP1 gp7 family putative phage head morphogenesis protein
VILHCGGRNVTEVRRELKRVLEATKPKRTQSTVTAAHRRVERERIAAKVEGTAELKARLLDAVARMKREALQSIGFREASSETDRWNFDVQHIARAFKPTIEVMYRHGVQSATEEIAARLKHREAATRTVATVGTSFTQTPDAAIDALYQYELEFAKDVTEREKAALKWLLLDGLQQGLSGPEMADLIREHFAGGMHFVDADGTLTRTIPDNVWAEMVARTETARANNLGVMDTYKSANVESVIWLSAEDERTCPDCDELDETSMPIGQEFDDGVTEPPDHASCRCTIVSGDFADDARGPATEDDEAA